MKRKSRRPPFVQGHYYHIYNRGAGKAKIFQEDDNYYFVLGRIKKYGCKFDLTVLAYCLMPNHYHLLVRQDGERAAGLLPQRVFNSYSKAYNRKYEHSGTLFEGPYKVVHVTEEAHLRHLCRYIHANPVKNGVVESIEDWPYSNYLEWVGKRSGTLVDRIFVEDFYGTSSDYEEFVRDYLLVQELPLELAEYLEN